MVVRLNTGLPNFRLHMSEDYVRIITEEDQITLTREEWDCLGKIYTQYLKQE